MNPALKRRLQLGAGLAVFAIAVAVSYFSISEEEQGTAVQDIFLVIDVSGSMADESKLAFAKRAATEFVNVMTTNQTTNHHIGLITFADNAVLIEDLGDDSQKLTNSISNLYADGGTAMGDGILLAVDYLSQARSDTSKTIILLSDGAANSGHPPSNAAINTANNNIQIFAVGYGHGADEFTLRSISEITNGAYFDAPTGQDLAETFNEIANVLISPASHYSSRVLILIAIPVLLFIPAIEVGLTTMMGRLDDAPVKRNVKQTAACPHCSHSNRKTAKFCLKCGKALNPKSDDAPVKRNVKQTAACPHCSHSNRKTAKFCLKCGKNITKGEHD